MADSSFRRNGATPSPASTLRNAAGPFPVEAEVLVIGAGACGLTAALAAAAEGAEVLVLERDAVPSGSTALSAGLVPAAGTRWQAEAGVTDTAALLHADIQAKAKGLADPAVLDAAVAAAGPAITWLADAHGLPFELIDGFLYPGHSVRRMHAMPERSGSALVDRLRTAAEEAGITIVTSSQATSLLMDGDRVAGVGITRPDAEEDIGCRQLILACNGYGGNRAYLERHIPEILGALWFGHDGNDGTALDFGEALGADMGDLSGHQGHGSVAHPHGILITYAAITEGGFQVNAAGARFSNEAAGYSEQAANVLAQPGGTAFTIFDGRIADIARQFEDFQRAEAAGAITTASSVSALAQACKIPQDTLEATMAAIAGARQSGAPDAFGRTWTSPPLGAPYCAVRVTGALFHTQGGLRTDGTARVLRGGQPMENLFAAGGAAVGVSGPAASGYLSGNGLLTAVAMGRVAGRAAAGS
ncbi:FAD-dependent oxidoreductase [Acuticoccus sp. MNP-M23]|uniref:FAD-dependent oxidoreductase n=1 Tax=Acuticoccus sp. MNP-M23 TaxID=3072793 RepID=UPI002815F3CE|nr:FAD-dependent oxidoreductase [Acuticoccus sp. MNP-M23]WMS42803.1 FAD-dependent oxidoreductase [Acuticoccus sp. MNP-M23]